MIETKDTMTEWATAEVEISNQVVNAGDVEDVAILPETLSALQEERPVPNVFRWDILQLYAKPGVTLVSDQECGTCKR